MSYPVADIPGVDPLSARLLKAQGIRTSEKLLEIARNPRGRRALADKTGIENGRLLAMVTAADRMRVHGVSSSNARLLEAAGVNTVRDLKYRNPANLAKAMAEANRRRKMVTLVPTEAQVLRWIESAKKLPLKITY